MSKFSTPNEIYSAIISEILDHLENGNPVWRKAWNYQGYVHALANPLSDNPFTGRNIFVLAWSMMLRGYDSPFFATYKQIKAAGGNVKKK